MTSVLLHFGNLLLHRCGVENVEWHDLCSVLWIPSGKLVIRSRTSLSYSTMICLQNSLLHCFHLISFYITTVKAVSCFSNGPFAERFLSSCTLPGLPENMKIKKAEFLALRNPAWEEGREGNNGHHGYKDAQEAEGGITLALNFTKEILDLSFEEWSELARSVRGLAEVHNSMASERKQSSVWGVYAGWAQGG